MPWPLIGPCTAQPLLQSGRAPPRASSARPRRHRGDEVRRGAARCGAAKRAPAKRAPVNALRSQLVGLLLLRLLLDRLLAEELLQHLRLVAVVHAEPARAQLAPLLLRRLSLGRCTGLARLTHQPLPEVTEHCLLHEDQPAPVEAHAPGVHGVDQVAQLVQRHRDVARAEQALGTSQRRKPIEHHAEQAIEANRQVQTLLVSKQVQEQPLEGGVRCLDRIGVRVLVGRHRVWRECRLLVPHRWPRSMVWWRPRTLHVRRRRRRRRMRRVALTVGLACARKANKPHVAWGAGAVCATGPFT